ncbi:MAG TPA: amino acid adenylation domain-containing protein [Longimicrobium sp.]|nr:amino acid adenylation domain-containing protein [Longimicrobium sp.]
MSIYEVTERRAGLSPAKQAMLAKLLRGGVKGGAPAEDGIPRRDPASPAPLSGAQQRLWFLHQMEPGSAQFNIPLILRLRGALDAAALDRALAEIVRRHEALRTVFLFRDGAPVQEVRPATASVLWISDVPASAVDRESAVRAWVEAEANAPFDLAATPGFRARLLRVAAEEHVLVVTLHHIVSDGWSTGVLYRELAALYKTYKNQQESPLSPLPIQYADYAAWQRARQAGPDHARQVEFWRGRLAGAPVLLDLPTDRLRPAVQGSAGAAHRFRIPREVLDRLGALARAEGATPFMALAAAWAALLHRWSGEDDVVVGTPVAGRTHPQTEPLIGFFVQTLPLRMDLSGDPSFRALLSRARETTVEAFAHPDVPLDQLVDELKVERSLSHPPLFQAMISLQNASGAGPQLPGLETEPMGAEMRTAQGYLMLYMEEDARGLDAMLQYPAALWDAGTMERLATHLLTLMRAAAADPGARVSRLPLLADAERATLFVQSAGEDAAYPDLPVHRLFEAHAAAAPDAIALVFGERVMTRAELNTRANRLARRLRARGVGAEARVGVCLHRSPELVVALLAIDKAGGAYVPLDPADPPERLAWLREDAGAALVLSSTDLAEAVGDAPVLWMDREPLDAESAGNLESPPSAPPRSFLAERGGRTAPADALMYVIYTSGSTGRPKGAMNGRRGVLNRLHWMRRAYGIGADDVFLQKTPFSFDVSVQEFFLPLMTGARLVLARPGGHRDPAYLRELMRTQGVTWVHFVPAMLAAFLEQPGLEGLTALRHVFSSGEALPRALAERCLARLPASVELHNLYGPTEAAIDVSFWPCRGDDASRPVPIGRPVANTRLYVLDAALQPVPHGVTGELYIAGVQVGRGYLRRPALTAERFIPDPFSPGRGARMYRTGDRARVRPDGAIDYAGRADQQVKLRGFRIEPGEIETALRGHPEVRDAVAVVRSDGPGGARLVAYVVPRAGSAAPSAAALRAFLGGSLPEHMIPTAFVAMEALPLTASGKTDRRALPAPALPADRDHVPPTTPAEKTIAGFWAEALGVERVGVHDNFFELGGHSLLVTRLHARMEEAFAREITLVDLFRHTTVAAQAAFITAAAPRSGAPTVAQQRATDRATQRRAAAASRPSRR